MADSAGAGGGAGEGAGVGGGGAAEGAAGGGETRTSRAPRRSRIRKSPSRKSISFRSCWLISPTRYLIVRTSKGLGLFEASSATVAPAVCFLMLAPGWRRSKIKHQNPQLLGYARQHFAALGRHQHIVFDAHAAPSREVDARF